MYQIVSKLIYMPKICIGNMRHALILFINHYLLISSASVKIGEKHICLGPSTIIDFQFT